MSNGSVAQRFRMALNREEGMKSLDQVVLDYGYVEGNKFTFEDHEYQIEIMRDVAAGLNGVAWRAESSNSRRMPAASAYSPLRCSAVASAPSVEFVSGCSIGRWRR